MTLNEVVTIAVLLAVVGVLAGVWWFDGRRRRQDGSVLSGMAATFDDVFHPEAARAAEIREVQRELPAEAPNPGDWLTPGIGGRIEITIPGRQDGVNDA